MATATATKPADAKKDEAPAELTKKQVDEARALREGDPANGKDGLTFAEIATRLGVKGSLVSKALAGMPAGRAKPKGTVTPHERKPVGTVDWDSAVASVPALKGTTIAWRRATYCMVRADNGRSGVSSGSLIQGTGTAWATLCEHLTVHGAPKGASAETAGKERATWCKACAAGEPGVVGKVAKPEGEAKAAKPKGKATKEPATPEATEKAALLAAAREGGSKAVAEKVAEAKPAPKAQPKRSRASKNAERAAAALAKREAAAAAQAEGDAAEAAAAQAGDELDSIA